MSELKEKPFRLPKPNVAAAAIVAILAALIGGAVALDYIDRSDTLLGVALSILPILAILLFKLNDLESLLRRGQAHETERYAAALEASERRVECILDELKQQEVRLTTALESAVAGLGPDRFTDKDVVVQDKLTRLASSGSERGLFEGLEAFDLDISEALPTASPDFGDDDYLEGLDMGQLQPEAEQRFEAESMPQVLQDKMSDEETVSAADTFDISKDETVISVSYATNRSREIDEKSDLGLHYGSGLDELRYGRAYVSIPKKHKVGRLERPKFWQVFTKEKAGKHVVVRKLDEYGEDAFFSKLQADIKDTDGERAFVFVHGFNTSFNAGVRRAGQMAFDLFGIGRDENGLGRLSIAPIYFSWPSNGSAVSYITDTNRAEASIETFKLFLEDVSRRTGVKELTVIAHSMGNQVLTKALKRIGDQMRAGDAPFLKEIILAAPDIDERVFIDLVEGIKKTGKRITLYASRNDKALLASKKLNGFKRAGDASAPITVFEGGDTIDASSVGEDILAHTYVAETTVLQDLYNMILNGHPPSKRFGLIEAGNRSRPYWQIRAQ